MHCGSTSRTQGPIFYFVPTDHKNSWPHSSKALRTLLRLVLLASSSVIRDKIIIPAEVEPIVAQPAYMFNPAMAHEIEEQEKHAAASKIQAKYREYKARKESKEPNGKKFDGEPTATPPGNRDDASKGSSTGGSDASNRHSQQ